MSLDDRIMETAAIVMYSGGIGSWAAGMRVVERHVRHAETEAQARDLAAKLRTRSDAMHGASSAPIRVMPLAVWERMQEELHHPSSDDIRRRCRHGVFRLCIPCVSAAMARGE